VLGSWADNYVKWSFDFPGVLYVYPQYTATSFTETTVPGPYYLNILLPILKSLVQPLNTYITAQAYVQVFHYVMDGTVPLIVDPPAGYRYVLTENPGLPTFTSIILPTLDVTRGDNVGWHVTYYTDNGLSSTQTSYTGQFYFPQGVNEVDFYAIDNSGNVIPFNDTLLFTATVSGAGNFDATLATYTTPVVDLPLASGQSCNGVFNGVVPGNVTVAPGQSCTFLPDCEIQGSVTVTGGSLFLACRVDGNLTETAGSIELAPSASVGGNMLASQTGEFAVDAGLLVNGNLQIQGLWGGLQEGAVCGARISRNLQVQNNLSSLWIGGAVNQNCPGNTVGGNLLVDANSAALWIDYNSVLGQLNVDNNTGTTDVSGNLVYGSMQCQNNASVTNTFLNTVKGLNHGQCAVFP
jgi:hypothetical protein